MKNLLVPIAVSFALAAAAQAADVSVKLTGVHLCCQSCVKGAQKAVGGVPGVTASADQDAGDVSLTGPDVASVQKAVDALAGAGFFGKSSDASIKVNAESGAKGRKVQSLQVEGVHLCCGKCVDAVGKALESVSGVKGNTAAKGAKSFAVTGDFNDKDVFAALQKAGLTGKVGK